MPPPEFAYASQPQVPQMHAAALLPAGCASANDARTFDARVLREDVRPRWLHGLGLERFGRLVDIDNDMLHGRRSCVSARFICA